MAGTERLLWKHLLWSLQWLHTGGVLGGKVLSAFSSCLWGQTPESEPTGIWGAQPAWKSTSHSSILL